MSSCTQKQTKSKNKESKRSRYFGFQGGEGYGKGPSRWRRKRVRLRWQEGKKREEKKGGKGHSEPNPGQSEMGALVGKRIVKKKKRRVKQADLAEGQERTGKAGRDDSPLLSPGEEIGGKRLPARGSKGKAK